MLTPPLRKCAKLLFAVLAVIAGSVAQTPQRPNSPQAPTHANILRGEYGRYRANNDLLSYDLKIRIDPAKKFVNGTNTIRFKMLKDDTRIQLDLYDNLKIDEIVFVDGPYAKPYPVGNRTVMAPPIRLKYERDSGAVLVDFPRIHGDLTCKKNLT
jgi:hypothetical protein